MSLTGWIRSKLYTAYDPQRPGRLVESDFIFQQRVFEAVDSSHFVLNFGAGVGRYTEFDLRDRVKRVAGVDIDPGVLDHPYMHEAKVIEQRIPYDDDTFDLVYSNYVWEHLERPVEVLREVRRVLRPGGLYIAKTPSYFHYVALIARFTPHWFHKLVWWLRGNVPDDACETYYRLNTRRAIRRHAKSADFDVSSIEMIESDPTYLAFSPPTYLLGVLYERTVNSTRLLEPLRGGIVVTFRKPSRE